MMPTRKRTRAHDRAYRIAAEREINEALIAVEAFPQEITACNDPPPF